MIQANIAVRLNEISRRTGLIADRTAGLVYAISEWLRLVIRTSFERQATAEGAPWKPLTPRYAMRKKGPGILRETSAMFEQTTRGGVVEGNTVVFGSSLPYAAAHQFGFEGDVSVRESIRRLRAPGRDTWGKILGKNNKMVRGKIAMGVAFPKVAAHTRHMNIPARPFLPSREFAEAEGSKIAQEYLEGAVGKASNA